MLNSMLRSVSMGNRRLAPWVRVNLQRRDCTVFPSSDPLNPYWTPADCPCPRKNWWEWDPGWASRKWVGNFVQKRVPIRRLVFPTELYAWRYTMSRRPLTPEQQDEAQRIERILMESVRNEIRSIAELLASKPDRQLLGQTEFEVRDLVHKIGAKAIETALDQRKKGGTKDPQ